VRKNEKQSSPREEVERVEGGHGEGMKSVDLPNCVRKEANKQMKKKQRGLLKREKKPPREYCARLGGKKGRSRLGGKRRNTIRDILRKEGLEREVCTRRGRS